MPKQTQRAEVNSFVGGFNSEASLLNFPSNVSSDEINFDLNRDGSRTRRLGIDYTTGTTSPTSVTKANVTLATSNSFLWNAVNGDPNLNFIVVQTGRYLHFYDQATTDPVSSASVPNLTNMPVGTRFDFAALEGRLTVVGGDSNVAIIEYDAATPDFTVTLNSIRVRDLWGLYVGDATETDPGYGPTTLLEPYVYNLMNQSWGIPRINKDSVSVNPIDYYFQQLARYPSNSEQVWTGLAEQAVAASQTPFERIYANLWNEALGAKTQTAQGYFIIDALARGTSRATALAGHYGKYPLMANHSVTFPTDTTSGGAKCVTDFAGRIWYGGFDGTITDGDQRSPILNNYLFFSQLVRRSSDMINCYQDGDPTSRDTSDVVDTDGGFVRIAGAQGVQHLQNIGISLLVFCTNGVWAVTGGTTDSGFSATNYKVNKISNAGTTSPSSVVVDNGVCYFWSQDGIYVVGNSELGDLQVTSLTLDTIHKFYRAIPLDAKSNAVGTYDYSNKQIRWVYKTGTLYTNTSVTYELIFDPQLKAFTKSLIGQNNNLEVVDIVSTPNMFYQISSDTTSKLVSVRYVVFPLDTDGNTVLTTFAHRKDTTFVDWKTPLGDNAIDAAGYITTGTQIASDSGIDKQIPYLILHFNRTETGVDSNYQPTPASSCMFRGMWNFSNTSASNQWTPLRQGYRYVKPRMVTSLSDDYDTGYQIITTKNKLRGKGKAFALHFETEPGKDCQILGWNISLNANQVT